MRIDDKTIILTVKGGIEFGKVKYQFAIENGFKFVFIVDPKSRKQTADMIPECFRPCVFYNPEAFLLVMRVNMAKVEPSSFMNKARQCAKEHNEGGRGYGARSGPYDQLHKLWSAHLAFQENAAKYSFLNQIIAIFGEVKDYVEDREAMVVQFNTCTTSPRYDELEKLSKVLGTKKINLSETLYTPGFCDTCDHGAKYKTPISCWNVQFP